MIRTDCEDRVLLCPHVFHVQEKCSDFLFNAPEK